MRKKNSKNIPACWNCGYQSDFLLKCSGCKKARYCGETCYEEGWGKHQEWCNKKVEKRKGKMGNNIRTEMDNCDDEVD